MPANHHLLLALQFIETGDFETAVVHHQLGLHCQQIRYTFIINSYKVLFEESYRYFFKLYVLDPNLKTYDFLDFGWYENQRFIAWQSGICMFNLDIELQQIYLSDKSCNYLIVKANPGIFLLYNPNVNVIIKFMSRHL